MDGEPASWAIEQYKAVRGHEVELNRATAAFEHASLQPLYLLNGGALVAFLTLIGAIWKDSQGVQIVKIMWPLAAWSLGLVSAAAATARAYRSQRSFTKAVRSEREQIEFDHALRRGPPREDAGTLGEEGARLQNCALLMGALSLIFFGLGVGLALWSLSDVSRAPPSPAGTSGPTSFTTFRLRAFKTGKDCIQGTQDPDWYDGDMLSPINEPREVVDTLSKLKDEAHALVIIVSHHDIVDYLGSTPQEYDNAKLATRRARCIADNFKKLLGDKPPIMSRTQFFEIPGGAINQDDKSELNKAESRRVNVLVLTYSEVRTNS